MKNGISILTFIYCGVSFASNDSSIRSSINSTSQEYNLSEIDTITTHFFNKPAKWNYFPLSLGISYLPGFSSVSYKFNDLYHRGESLFSWNPKVVFNLAYKCNNKFSIEIPITTGLQVSKSDQFSKLEFLPGDYYSDYGACFYFNFTGVNLNFFKKSEYYFNFNYNKKYHFPEVLFQIGLAPKFYPFGQNMRSFYIGQQVSCGIASYRQVNFYHDMDTISIGNGPIVYLTALNAVSKINTFNFLRYETTIGADFNFSKYVAFNIETSFSSVLKNSGGADSVFYSIDNGPNQFAGTFKYKAPEVSGYYNNLGASLRAKCIFSIRFSLIIKIGTRREQD